MWLIIVSWYSMRTTRLLTNLEGTMKLSASIFMILDGVSLSQDGLRSNQLSSVLDTFSFKRIDALQVWISRMQSINFDLALMMSVVESVMYRHSCVSSAYRWIVIPWRWALYSGYARSINNEEEGPSKDPCGTPNRMLCVLEIWESMRILCERLERNKVIQISAVDVMPNWCWRICRRMAWSTQSKAALKSRSTIGRWWNQHQYQCQYDTIIYLDNSSFSWMVSTKPDCIGRSKLCDSSSWFESMGETPNELRDDWEIGYWSLVGWVREVETWFFYSRTNVGTFVSFWKSSWYQWYVDKHGENWSKIVYDISDMSMSMARIRAKEFLISVICRWAWRELEQNHGEEFWWVEQVNRWIRITVPKIKTN